MPCLNLTPAYLLLLVSRMWLGFCPLNKSRVPGIRKTIVGYFQPSFAVEAVSEFEVIYGVFFVLPLRQGVLALREIHLMGEG